MVLRWWFLVVAFRAAFGTTFLWCFEMFFKMDFKMIFQKRFGKEMHSFCKGFGKCFPLVFCVWRPRGRRIVLVDLESMGPLEKLSTSLRLRSGNQEAEESW